MAHGPNENDLLAWIEGESLTPEQRGALERAFEADGSLKTWAERARGDRDRLRALAEIEAIRAPQGLTSAAMELAEREALVGAPIEKARSRQSRRIRITPLRFVAAAGLVIAAGAASLVGFLMTDGQPGASMLAQGSADEPVELAMLEESDDVMADAGAPVEGLGVATMAMAPQPSSEQGALAARSSLVDGAGEIAAKQAGPSIQFRLIHPAEHAPEHALSPERAAELAAAGRTLLLVRAQNPAAVEAALLKRDSENDVTSARWRRIVETVDGGSDLAAARLVVADALTTPAAMQRLIADVASTGGGVQGAWLQELADAVKLETTFTPDDLMWWEQPPTAWAPRAAVPVLIERVGLIGPDAESSDPAPATR